jgi:hypothetical protein
MTVSLAVLSLALVLPRPVDAGLLPLPQLDPAARVRAEQQKSKARARVHAQALPFSVRAVGEAVRRYGHAELTRDPPQISGALAHLRRTVVLAQQEHGAERLLELRAVQSDLFLRALRAWETTGQGTADLSELGGSFLERARAFGWVDAGGQLQLSEAERVVLFDFRWLELLNVREQRPFAPSLEEWRRYFRCLLEHPHAAGPEGSTPDADRARLTYVDALAKIDSEYPAALARGVLHQRLGEPLAARGELEQHLQAHPHAAWALRARNYWLATFQR